MTGRQRIRALIAGDPADRHGFWLGNPHHESLPALHSYFGTSSLEELHCVLGSDLRWITPQYMETTYRHPKGHGIFDVWKTKKSLGEAGPLAGAEAVGDIDRFDWPDPEYLDFTECLRVLRESGEVYRASGFWMPFFHDVMDLFGAEEFLVKLHTNPAVVHAAFTRVCRFYFDANERFFAAADGEVDGFFFGNDFGTQLDLLIAPAQFDEFVLPWIRCFAGQARARRLQVILHSCGSIHRIIGRLIDAGVDCLHPLQARAAGMDAVSLAAGFGGRVTFLGGVDTQDLLVRGSTEEIAGEVRRLMSVFGPRWIISPSHEAILPDVPPRNVEVLARTAGAL
jgi:uroporphyrinogen decarboxylase